ncbi:MAG: hypothetical protein ACWA40_01320 [Planktomarina sp.]
MRTVICMKWGTLYSADYVNVLYNAVRDHMTGPFRFVCLTDDPTDLDPNIDHFPIPDMELSDFNWKKGGWAKLCVFKKELYDIEGRCLFIDLDTVICGPLDDFFDYPGDVVVIDTGPNWKTGGGTAPKIAGTGIFTFTAGQYPDVFDKYMADQQAAVAKYRIEQYFLQGELPEGAMQFWPLNWVLSFKYHLRRPLGAGFFMKPGKPPKDARVIAFHGEPRPIDLVAPGYSGIFPHLVRGNVGWMRDYWTGYGGRLP